MVDRRRMFSLERSEQDPMAALCKPIIRSTKEEFGSEAAMCSIFLESVEKVSGWVAYSETWGWDILLVRKVDGFQVGIQAKMKLNAVVFKQAIEGRSSANHGPDCAAILVPPNKGAAEFRDIAAYIGITIISCNPLGYFYPDLPDPKTYWGNQDEWSELFPASRVVLPAYVPDVQAGVKSPTQLTSWKIGALKLIVILENEKVLRRDDFRHAGINHRLWTAKGNEWLLPDKTRLGWVEGPKFPHRIKTQHPVVYAEIQGTYEKWKAKPTLGYGHGRK